MKRLAAVALMTVILLPGVAFAGSSTDAALGLGAFAVFNQILGGVGIFGRPAVVVAPVPPVVYAPPAPVVYAPPPPVVYGPPRWCTRLRSRCTSFGSPSTSPRGQCMAIVSTRIVTGGSGTGAGSATTATARSARIALRQRHARRRLDPQTHGGADLETRGRRRRCA